jgi:hypothetical protein
LSAGHPDRIEAELDLAALALAAGSADAAQVRLRALVEFKGDLEGLAFDLPRALAARCLAAQAASADAQGYWRQADQLLAPYLEPAHALRQPGSDRCPGIGWLAASAKPGTERVSREGAETMGGEALR